MSLWGAEIPSGNFFDQCWTEVEKGTYLPYFFHTIIFVFGNVFDFAMIFNFFYLNIFGKKAYIGIIPEVPWALKAQKKLLSIFFFVKWQCDARCPWRLYLNQVHSQEKFAFLSQKKIVKTFQVKNHKIIGFFTQKPGPIQRFGLKNDILRLCPCVFTNFLRFLFHFRLVGFIR